MSRKRKHDTESAGAGMLAKQLLPTLARAKYTAHQQSLLELDQPITRTLIPLASVDTDIPFLRTTGGRPRLLSPLPLPLPHKDEESESIGFWALWNIERKGIGALVDPKIRQKHDALRHGVISGRLLHPDADWYYEGELRFGAKWYDRGEFPVCLKMYNDPFGGWSYGSLGDDKFNVTAVSVLSRDRLVLTVECKTFIFEIVPLLHLQAQGLRATEKEEAAEEEAEGGGDKGKGKGKGKGASE